MKYITLFAFALFGLFAFPACNNPQFDATGVYHGDQFLYQTDQAVVTTFNLFDVYVKWEYNNRALLTSRPEVRKSADYIRANAKQWRNTVLALRDAYAANPSADNKLNLTKALAVIQAAMTEATQYLTATST